MAKEIGMFQPDGFALRAVLGSPFIDWIDNLHQSTQLAESVLSVHMTTIAFLPRSLIFSTRAFMSNSLVYIAWDAKSISKRVERAVLQDDPNTIKQTSRNVQRGNDIMQSWLEQHDGDLLFAHGDEGWASLPGQKIEELQVVHEEMQEAWGDDISIGVGLDLAEAKKALDLAIKRGSGNILFYTPEIEEEQEKEKDEKDNGVLNNLLDKATPEDALSAMGGAQQAASPAVSASEHSQSEQALANAAAVPPPALDDVEGQFHNMAQQGEQQEAQRQAQEQASAQNAEDPGQQVEELKQQVASILAKVKKQAPALEQMKEQNPEAYAAISSMVQAMIAMARQLMDIQGQQAQAPVQMAKDEDQLSFPGMEPPPPPPRETHPNNPSLAKIKLYHGGADASIEGYIPAQFYPPGVEPEPVGGGYQSATSLLGDYAIKLQHHKSIAHAEKYLTRIAKLKRLGLSTVVPIIDAGHFAETPRMFSNITFDHNEGPASGSNSYFTYEILKKLHPLEERIDTDELKEPLREAGYGHKDAHEGNRMQDSDGNPMLIDLESIVTLPRREPESDEEIDRSKPPREDMSKAVRASFPTPDDALVGVSLTHQNEAVRGKIKHKWAKLSRQRIGFSGYQGSTHELGLPGAAAVERGEPDSGKYVLKIQHHPNITKARKYVARINRFKRLGFSTVVPILDVGLFGESPAGHDNAFSEEQPGRNGYFTYEVMKKLHTPSGNFSRNRRAAADELANAGYHHTDLHEGNLMMDTLGNPKIIDLESIKTIEKAAIKEREIDPNKPVTPSHTLDKAGPMPGSQGNLGEAARLRLPHGVVHTEIQDKGRGGHREIDIVNVDHVTPDGKPASRRVQITRHKVRGFNLREVQQGVPTHAVSAVAPWDGKAGQSAAATNAQDKKGTVKEGAV
jgi:hypothetical protein